MTPSSTPKSASSRVSSPLTNAPRPSVSKPKRRSLLKSQISSNQNLPPGRTAAPEKKQQSLLSAFKITPTTSNSSPSPSSTTNDPPPRLHRNRTTSSTDPTQILKGVVACLDIRTEDGDDVSQNFERALQSMGAKTRRTFSDAVTHLVYKNGSSTTLQKALSKNVYIVNLLWITRCKTEKRRLDEKDFFIERPQGLALTGKKRRKSMEPSRLRALAAESNGSDIPTSVSEKRIKTQGLPRIHITPDPRRASEPRSFRHTSSSSSSSLLSASSSLSSHTHSHLHNNSSSSAHRRKTMDPSLWETGDLSDTTALSGKDSNISATFSELALDGLDVKSAEPSNTNHDRTSSPLDNYQDSLDRRNRELDERRKKAKGVVIPTTAPDHEIKAQIKADFFVGQVDTPKPSRMSSPTVPRLKRKRRSMGVPSRLSLGSYVPPLRSIRTSDASIVSESSSLLPLPSEAATASQPTTTKLPTVVMTSLDEATRQKCTEIIKRLGRFEVVKSQWTNRRNRVDDSTTHVIVGRKRMTESVALGMVQGIWLVTPSWIIKCGESEKYIDEAEFEALEWFPRASAARQQDAVLPSNVNIYISSTFMSADFANQLITKAGGQVVNQPEDADIIISKHAITSDKVVVTEQWLLDSIEQWRYLPTGKYSSKRQ
ncbi:uncharacterized protein BYT42DRAFT_615172 [Radiomyces spectabilis]|uniref:uncharacterized protein n=1 Tax=Radiomyces spectabilis TaxID=64574 RepID=UPI00221E994A|nr:uncharacterized protein BYT42DRAFT_615172 [Radiomyces spectabilis]KAI8376434.1 hypothetical protein BYT42DRAFT_615172 [Radiomyces spectabilis]